MTSVIIIDDDFDIVEVFSEFLMLHDIDVLGKAYDGLEGIKLYEKKLQDIAFSDISMPVYDWFYLLTNLKKTFPHSKVIMITGDLTTETHKKLRELKVDSIIFKPFDIKQILDAIQTVLKDSKQIIYNSI